MIRLGLAAASLAGRLGLRTLLESDPELAVEAASGDLAALAAEWDQGEVPDVLVVLGATVWGQAPPDFFDTWPVNAVLLLTNNPQVALALLELPLRAWGLLPEDCSAVELTTAVHTLALGLSAAPAEMLAELYYNPTSLDSVPGVRSQASEAVEDLLTDREIDVLELLALGLANKQIASELQISAHTVKFHVSSIYTKLRATNRTEAVRLGLQNGLISL